MTVTTDMTEPEYTEYRAEIDGLPLGMFFRAETDMNAMRQLQIAASRLGFEAGNVDLIPTDD